MAILAGDALLSTSFQWVAEKTPQDKVDPSKILDVVTRLGKAVGAKGLVGGQVMDLLCEGKRGKRDVTVDDLRWIHTHKTAALLLVAVSCGAILAGATDEEVKACEKFALNVGLAFQVADDILDVTQSTEELGKTAGKDEAVDKEAAAFFSDINVIRGAVQGALVDTAFGQFLAPGHPDGTEVEIVFRPQHVKIDFDRGGRGPNPTPQDGTPARGIVARARFMGHESLVEFRMDFDGGIVKATVPAVFLPKPGTPLWLTVRRDRCFVFAKKR